MTDVIIIGAGAAGLMAAKNLSEKGINVLVLEARNRLGGRIYTIENKFTENSEAGAEFIHGNLALTSNLLKQAGLKQTKVKGELVRMEDGHLKAEEDFVEGWGLIVKRLKKLKTDVTISAFLEAYMPEKKYAHVKETFKKYIQGYDSADIRDASAISIREEMDNEEDEQFRIEKGYGSLVNFLAEECKKNGCIIEISTTVKQINWQQNHVELITNNKTYSAQKVVITVPIGVLQAKEGEEGALQFYPEIFNQQKEINNIGFGKVIKILLEFDEPFWFEKNFLKERGIDKPFFFFADTFIPTWWTQYPAKNPLLVGWLSGPDAAKYNHLDENEFIERAIGSLAKIFKMTSEELYKRLKVQQVHNWVTDPFCRGAYSYATVKSKKAIELLKKPLENTIYFAGEAFAKNPTATVDAALQSGEEVAERVLLKRLF